MVPFLNDNPLKHCKLSLKVPQFTQNTYNHKTHLRFAFPEIHTNVSIATITLLSNLLPQHIGDYTGDDDITHAREVSDKSIPFIKLAEKAVAAKCMFKTLIDLAATGSI